MKPRTEYRSHRESEKRLYKIYKVSWGRLEGQLCVLSAPDQSQKLSIILSGTEIV